MPVIKEKGSETMQLIFSKLLWGSATILGLAGGIVGTLLPIIPGIPFFILAIFSLSKVSPKFHQWLTHTRPFEWLNRKEPKLAKWIAK